MKKIGVMLFLSFLLCATSRQVSYSQVRTANLSYEQIQPLSIGDKIPEALWNMPLQIVNDPEGKTTTTLADYRGKLIILDFWATWCSPCIANFPIMHSLQNNVGKKLMILPVTPESKSLIMKFFQGEKGKALQYVPSVVNDSILSKLFPHNGVPHMVWISSSGRIINTTRADEVTYDNVNAILHNRVPKMASKIDIDRNRPLFLSKDFPEGLALQSYSILIKGAYMGLPSASKYQKDQNGNILGRQWTNLPMMTIYYPVAFDIFKRNSVKFDLKRVIADVKKPKRLNWIKIGPKKYDRSNLYSYELIVPRGQVDSLYYYMLSDLNRNSEYTATIERRKVKCLLLVRTSTKDLIKSKGGKGKNSFPGTPSILRNSKLSYMLNRLNGDSPIKLPIIIDGTGYTENVDIEISEVKSLKQLKNEFNKYDLDLIETEKELLMFVIKDK